MATAFQKKAAASWLDALILFQRERKPVGEKSVAPSSSHQPRALFIRFACARDAGTDSGGAC
jgi:hypothetical protein